MSVVRRVILLAAALSVSFALLGPAPASAHTAFEQSNPNNGETMLSEVGEIIITFSGAAQPAGEGFVVLDPTGMVRTPESVTSDATEREWVLSFDPPLAEGAVGVRWTVQAPDAHPISGSFSFTVSTNPTTRESNQGGRPTAPPVSRDATGGASGESGRTDALTTATTGVQDLNEFLQTEASVPNAEGIGAFGRLLGFVGTMLGIGGLAFAAVVVRDHRRDLCSVLKAVRYAAAIVVIGTAIDFAAHLAVASGGWTEMGADDAGRSVLLSTFGLAVTLRAAAGVLLFTVARSTRRHLEQLPTPVADRVPAYAGRSSSYDWDGYSTVSQQSQPGVSVAHRPNPTDVGSEGERPITLATIVSVLVLLASFTFDGHTVTEGNRWITAAVDMVHVVAASIWAGGVVAFSVVLWRRYRRAERLNGLELALRFSVIAGAALAVAGVAGVVLAAIILDTVSELWTTPWGRLLVAKTAAVAAAASLGTYNHFVVIPWMNAHPSDDGRSVKLRNTATGEALLLVTVIVITAFLVGAPSQP